jgi:hypothetical protein
MIDEQQLREGLQRLLRDTETAIRDRISDEPSIERTLRERRAAAVQAGRTAGSASGYNSFADEAITQSGVHWLLGCVFVRFLEDNGWLDERNKLVACLAGPGERLAIAKDERTRFLRPDPALTDRDYLLQVFGEVAKLPGMAGLFDCRHNPLFQLGPTAQGAAKIVEFFQKVDPDTGTILHDFADPAHGTRFLGDLYQNLSESAQKHFALCQTPDFVIDFILDRTLTPAIDTFGLESVSVIDPTCGSGHFLLAAFSRLFRLWQQREPSTNTPALAQKVLNAISGVDLNPFAVAIARFRLAIAALSSCSVLRLKDAPDFQFHLATGDSLLHGPLFGRERAVQRSLSLVSDPAEHFYDTEDAHSLLQILGRQYHAVVGNPPYINVSDPTLRELYRARFGSCHGRYQLSVPFIERFFDLGASEDRDKGYIGLIVSNAFMKRTFGKKLIEEYVPRWDLTHVIDTSGAHIPDHGTPTAILFGRHRPPVGDNVRAVRGIRGEMVRPKDPSSAPVWTAIIEQVDKVDSESKWVSVADASRSSFHKHPWSIGGGGAAELKELLEDGRLHLEQLAEEIGLTAFTGEDDVFLFSRPGDTRRLKFEFTRPLVEGDIIREWHMDEPIMALWVYLDDLVTVRPLSEMPQIGRHFWKYARYLKNRKRFGVPMVELDMVWYEWRELYPSKLREPLSIAYAEIATSNHFVLDRGGKLFKQTAPVIKLPVGSTENDYLSLLGLLNSSTGSFWFNQVCYNKGAGGISEGLKTERWEQFICLNAATIKHFPVSSGRPLEISRRIQHEADSRTALLPTRLCAQGTPSVQSLEAARDRAEAHLALMIALQEELDWQVYYLYGLLEEDLSLGFDQIVPIRLGERSFEIMMARDAVVDEPEATWFSRHGSKPITELPLGWPQYYRDAVEQRLNVITNPDIALLERPEYKRRWNLAKWGDRERSAVKGWLLDRIEANEIWREHGLVSGAQLRDWLARDKDWVSVAAIYNGGPLESLDQLVAELMVGEAVPFLPVIRYTEAGLRKRAEWDHVWDLQREEDGGKTVHIPVPPKYRSNDFLKSDYWRLRGSLDVSKERFLLYPGLERDSDRSPVLGWAGWNHLQQAKALAGYCQRMRTEEGWEPERLKPVLAGLLDLKPWLLQWHNELDRESGVKLGEYFVQFAESQCQELGFSPEEVRAWQPAVTARARARRTNARRPQ